ncbi:MAG: ABC transporter permease subunit [Nitrospina sp.]|nr:ABC transporter permease subunit [Nitrospina sp.]MBT3857581.1 ABC transporter permease subunit [Nitrospina sp.]MBT4104985.1 ABC transporter permease subunit [Nitrospina sp.]MBT4389152.1 ABC transporter permease subunit [Nitrospina sp.]MBT4619751.1 ABC transporter permease subunit [Nitrospina sp.]
MKLNKEMKVKLDIFKKDKRSFYSFLILAFLFIATLPAELICNVRPIMIVVEGKPFFPITVTYSEKDFGGSLPSEPDYKSARFLSILNGVPEAPQAETKDAFDLGMDDFEDEAFSIGLDDFEDSGESITPPAESAPLLSPRETWTLWPPVRYDYKYIPTESNTGNVVLAAPYRTLTPNGKAFIASSWGDGHYLGTDDRGRDVLARLIYGFRISMIFGASLAITGTLIGCLIGGAQGFFGGWVDLVGQRMTEIWGSIPRLYILIILSSFLVPSALLLFLILNLTAWMGIAAYIRAEFLKIRNFEFVKAAKGLGVSNFTIMRKHILPNALTPVVTFFPFEVTAGILALVSLDFLNLGVPSPAPSIGELLSQGKNNLQALWILLPTFTSLTLMITLLTFVGEGIRNAFDPRKTL